jgi:phosphoglycolate phosphatase
MDLLRPIIPNQTEADILAKQQIYYSNLEQRPVKNLHKILKQLSDLGYLLNIATNDLKDPTLAQLKKIDIANFFIEIIGSDSGYGAKPEPSQLLEIARTIGLKASEVVMVGDSVHDMIAARKANFKAIGVLTGVATKEDLQPYSDVVLNDISYLLSWIEKQNITATITR